MSVEAISIALHHSRSRGTTKLVLIGIANHHGDGGAYPSIRTLSKYAAVSHRNVQKAIRELEQLGEIEVLFREGGQRWDPDYKRTNLYRFLLACPPDCDRSPNHNPLSDTTGGVERDTSLLSLATPPPLSDTTPKPSIKPPINQPAAKGGGTALARKASERWNCVDAFGFGWAPAWSRYLAEDRACGILFREGVRDSDEARRVLAEWAAAGARGFHKGAADALIWICRHRASLAHTAAGDERLGAWR